MSSPAAPDELLPWALAALGASREPAAPELSCVAGDASARRYFRLQWQGVSYILVSAPPATENNAAFLASGELLRGAGVRTPAVYAADLERGFLLLEDFGDALLLGLLDEQTVDEYYAAAFDILQSTAVLAPVAAAAGLGEYDAALLQEELQRFPAWFVEALLGVSLAPAERSMLERCNRVLIDSALAQPRVLVHRDFHSRNLMLLEDGRLGVIDFQDAVIGPLTYDPVSLLKDCYVCWPAPRVRDWALAYLARLQAAGQFDAVREDEFLRWFDLMGLQRHVKVLGTFARLYLRDGKSAYLDDLPLVLDYVRAVLADRGPQEPVLVEFRDWFETRLAPTIAAQPWSRAT